MIGILVMIMIKLWQPVRKMCNTETKVCFIAAFALLVDITRVTAMHCEQKWDDIKAPHTVAAFYGIHLLKINTSDEYETFLPNTKYQVLMNSDDEDAKFTRFFLTVENENKLLPHGQLELYDEELSQFSQQCPNSVVQTSQVFKEEISAYWTSPDEGNGCVIFRGSIMESQSRWFMDGSLERKFCQDPKASIDDPGPVLPECCACEEAKYELAFEGLWSRYTHPKNFPSKPWNARFSDVVGASHTSNYRFWEYDDAASDGLKQVAENGITRVLESELKNQSEHIRTIIKARGINFPNITSKTFAVFRVDQQHHLMSIVSMIDPSPDWFVGVSGLELCLENCSWVEHKELNLYPVDAGTDDGITYESIDKETDPRDVIRRITTSWPADERSPFYDETAIDMNPMARVYIKRQRIYEKECTGERQPDKTNDEGANNDNKKPHRPHNKHKPCRTTAWSEWEPCSVTCGVGFQTRTRKYKNEKSAAKHNCDKTTRLTQKTSCVNENNPACTPTENDDNCPLQPWSEWTPCEKSCGPEFSTRDRNFMPKSKRRECRQLYPDIELEQSMPCNNAPCPGESADEDTVSVEPLPENEEEGQEDQASKEAEEKEEGDDEEEEEENLVGAENRQKVTKHIRPRKKKKCKDDHYTEWSFWSPCSVTCGEGTKSRSRQILPEYNNSPNADSDSGLYECQHESMACEAEDAPSCEITKEMKGVICNQKEESGSCDDGHNDNSLRYFYNRYSNKCVVFHYSGCNGNMNNFRTIQECQETCGNFSTQFKEFGEKKKKKKHRADTRSNFWNGKQTDCEMTEWSEWSTCYSCKGYRSMSRDIKVHPRNGGKLCPTKLVRRQKCHKVMPECGSRDRNRHNAEEPVSVNCRVSPWGPWSPCTSTCGFSQRRRIRNVAVYAQGPRGKPCPQLDEIEDCRVPAC